MNKLILIILFNLILTIIYSYSQNENFSVPKGQLLPVPTTIGSKFTPPFKILADKNIFFQENFESENESWIKRGSYSIGPLIKNSKNGYNSLICASTNFTINYPDKADSWLISPSISLPNLTKTSEELKLIFWERFKIESEYDHGMVKISTDDGNNWTLLSDRSGSSEWRKTSIDITSYSSQSIRIAFHFTSDDSITFEGWAIDDIQIEIHEPEPFDATMVSLNHQKFPFIYMNVAVDTFRVGFPGLNQSDFKVYENNTLQTDYFEVTPPDIGGGSRLADIIFLMDNSGSMSEEINAVSNNVIDFVNNLVSAGVNFALGLCRYGASYNYGNPIIEDNGILTTDANFFKINVWKRNNTGGKTEPGYYAITQSSNSFSFRPGAQKIFIIITDETPDQGGASLNDALSACTNSHITLFALTTSDLYDTFSPITEATNGAYFDIYSNFDDILTYISTQVANNYLVKYKSSNTVSDGTLRNVDVVVTYAGNIDTCSSSYIPGSAPIIQRTQATIDLHNNAWVEGTIFNIEADIVDNVVPYVSSVRLYYRKTGSTTYNYVNMNLVFGSTYQGVIPGNAVHTPGLDYYITATDGQNTASDPSVDSNNNPYQIAILPNVASVITHTPVTTLVQGNPIPISAQIFDNTNSVALAKLFYRKTGQLTYQSVELINNGGNNYQGEIAAEYVTNDGVEYYLQATDNFGVSGYYGTPDIPISIMNSVNYVNEKEAIINFFLRENFYINSEREAQKFVEQIKQKINKGTVTSKDIDALRRLSLVEGSAKNAYTGAIKVADLTSECTMHIAMAIAIEFIFKNLTEVLKVVKDWPLINELYKSADDLIRQMKSFRQTIRLKFVTQTGNSLGAQLKKVLRIERNLAQSVAFKLCNRAFVEIESQVYEKTSETVNDFIGFDPVKETITRVYLNTYENGIPMYFSSIGTASGKINIGGTQDILVSSIDEAKKQNFNENNINFVDQIIRNVKNPELNLGNRTTIESINSKIDLAELVSNLGLAVTIVVGIAVVILGILSCPAGGIGCIIAAIGGLGIWGALSSLLAFFNVMQIALYSWGMGIGIHQLQFNLPNNINEIRQIAFDNQSNPLLLNSALTLKTMQTSTLENDHQHYSSIPTNWADSLIYFGNDITVKINVIKLLIQQERWEDAREEFELIYKKLDQFSRKKNLVNSILDISYQYNCEKSNKIIDSLYFYTGAYSASDDIGNGFSKFAISFALFTRPDGSTKDTLIQIINESVNRLQAVGPTYKQTFQKFNSWGFHTPPIVSIIDYQIEENKTGFDVKCYIKNISDLTVHDIAISLTESSDIGVQIIAKTDTLFSTMNPGEEKGIEWQVTCFAQNKLLLFYADAHPLVSPGDFQGDKKIISQMMGSSPPIPTPLDDKNIYAYPNPFNPALQDVSIRFMSAKAGNVTIKIYDVSNTLVTTLISDVLMEDGKELAVRWDGKNDNGEIVANGTYFYRITTSSGEEATGKLALLR